MLVVQKRCKVCQRVKRDKKLLNRLYNCSYFIPHSEDTARKIAEDESIQYRALLVHIKKHQFIDSVDYSNKLLEHQDRQAEKKAVVRAVKAVDTIQSIINEGNKRLEDGEITVSTDQLIRAAQVKMTAEAKEKDQQLSYISMIAHFASGSANRERIYAAADDASAEPSDDY